MRNLWEKSVSVTLSDFDKDGIQEHRLVFFRYMGFLDNNKFFFTVFITKILIFLGKIARIICFEDFYKHCDKHTNASKIIYFVP